MSDIPTYHGPGPAGVVLPPRTTSIDADAAILPIDTVMQFFNIHCVAGTNMLNTASDEFKNFDAALAIVKEQKGCVAIYWGPLAHDTTWIQILIGWRTLTHSKNFRHFSLDFGFFCHHLTLISRNVPYTAPTYHFRAHPSRPFSFPPTALIYQLSHFYTIAPQSGPNESFADNLEAYLRIITADVNGPYEGAFGHILDLEERRGVGELGDPWGECMVMLIPWQDLGQWLRMVLSDLHEYAVPFTLWGRKHDDMMFTLFRHYWTTSVDADVSLLELDAS